MSAMDDLIAFYGEPISTYTRADAIHDGTLRDVSQLAREAGYNIPVAMTAAAYADLAFWDEVIEKRKPEYTGQDTTGRLWDVFSTMRLAAKHALRLAAENGTGRAESCVYRVPRDGRGLRPRGTMYAVVVGGDDQGAPCITVMLPNES